MSLPDEGRTQIDMSSGQRLEMGSLAIRGLSAVAVVPIGCRIAARMRPACADVLS
jgi:hypothetical protein